MSHFTPFDKTFTISFCLFQTPASMPQESPLIDTVHSSLALTLWRKTVCNSLRRPAAAAALHTDRPAPNTSTGRPQHNCVPPYTKQTHACNATLLYPHQTISNIVRQTFCGLMITATRNPQVHHCFAAPKSTHQKLINLTKQLRTSQTQTQFTFF